MINSFVTGVWNVLASARVKRRVDYADPHCAFAVKVNRKHLMELLRLSSSVANITFKCECRCNLSDGPLTVSHWPELWFSPDPGKACD